MPCGADLSGDLDLHQLLYQRTHRFAKEVHIRSGLVKKLLQRDANVGGHGGFLLPCCCCSNTHGTRSWPLASREQPPSGIYTTTWDSSQKAQPGAGRKGADRDSGKGRRQHHTFDADVDDARAAGYHRCQGGEDERRADPQQRIPKGRREDGPQRFHQAIASRVARTTARCRYCCRKAWAVTSRIMTLWM